MDTRDRLFDHATAARDPAGVVALLRALGFNGPVDPVPAAAWPAYGLASGGDVATLAVAGRAGSLDALLFELAADRPPDRLSALASAVRARNPVRLHLFVFLSPGRLLLATHGPAGEFRFLAFEPERVRPSDVDALEEMAPRDGESGLALALRQARALDRSRVTGLFFRDFRAHRHAVAAAFTGLPRDAARERSQLALLFLCRLTFLYFLQRRGTLCGDDQYLIRLFGEWAAPAGESFFRGRLVPLFFGALNRSPKDRSPAARALGDLPYLNGGLFEPHAIERRFTELDLPDATVRSVLDGLLERYRFTSREAGEGAGYGVDPEVLGRVFEGLMAPSERGETGSFYTPAPVVNRVVREALGEYLGAAVPGLDTATLVRGEWRDVPPPHRYRARRSLERLRVLDPACGSGAFLLGALHHLAAAAAAVSGEPDGTLRRDIVARSLHGVDLLDDAALLCSLRLWLALSEGDDAIRPLPNLDRRIRQGDALVDPLDLSTAGQGLDGVPLNPLQDRELRQAYRAVAPAARSYLDSTPSARDAARARLADAERTLARRWVERVLRLHSEHSARLGAAALDRDLFGDVPDQARRARAALDRAAAGRREMEDIARQLRERGSLPFFSFGVHFADCGGAFDLIVSNPPWVRAHRWPDRLRRLVARQYEVCRSPGWPAASRLVGATIAAGAQVDLSLLFLERCARLLAPGGVLAILIPAKALRALYGGPARRILLRDLELALIEDHALDQRSIFRADAFAAVLIARRPGPGAGRGPDEQRRSVRVRMVRRGVAPLEFRIDPATLPLVPDDPASPWMVAPPDVMAILRSMQQQGPALGRHDGLRIRRGVMTGANDVLVMRSVNHRLGGLARVEATGYATARRKGRPAREAGRFRAYVETAGLRPLVRGADIDAFRFAVDGHLVWCHDADGEPHEPPPRLARYLARHRAALEGRPGWRPGLPTGVVFRMSADTLRPKVAWHDLSDTVRAVALPAHTRVDGVDRELIPLNTVYFLPVAHDRDGLVLAALLNSLPVRVFARTIAERAKDARFRFFAWTMACLPLPSAWREHPVADDIADISRWAHARRGMGPEAQARLDQAVATLYRLDADQLETLDRFDRWLRGRA
jgi:SAM-dependent methyltransferase